MKIKIIKINYMDQKVFNSNQFNNTTTVYIKEMYIRVCISTHNQMQH